MTSVKVGSRNQITIPSEARKRLGIHAGDRLTLVVRSDEIALRLRRQRASDRLLGIAKGMYGPDPAAYLRDLRTESDRRPEQLRAMEREADADIAAGRVAIVDGIEGLIEYLDD